MSDDFPRYLEERSRHSRLLEENLEIRRKLAKIQRFFYVLGSIYVRSNISENKYPHAFIQLQQLVSFENKVLGNSND